MKLDTLYSLRTEFTVIGLTGRTGSGCSRIAELLSGDFEKLKEGLRDNNQFDDPVFKRKYVICEEFLNDEKNWCSYEIIKYVDVLIFFILNKYGNDIDKIKQLLTDNYKESKEEDNSSIVESLVVKITKLYQTYSKLIDDISYFKDFESIRIDSELEKLEAAFFNNEFKKFKNDLFDILESNEGYFKTRLLLHWVSCNIRSTGEPMSNGKNDISNIFVIAKLLNRLIKAKRHVNKKNKLPTKIVIDSLRNSLEIMFFKERYSAFYMVATKNVIADTRERLKKRLIDKIKDDEKCKQIIEQVIKLDEVEYRTKDFSRGKFSSPDVANCIQKSDFHIFNLKEEKLNKFCDENFEGKINGFFTREEQLMKLIALIQQPGLITPSSSERAMQIANTAKLNSGCISRKVGAVVTDDKYYIQSLGWNDVAKGHTPCNLRTVSDFFKTPDDLTDNLHYSKFEKGEATETSTYNYKGDNPGNFKEALNDYFKESFDKNKSDLNGKNCSFCFKTIHNHYEGEANQVHTRSLHAEENAMLQITKLGGIGINGGYLFTTASPCELCSKKAYQLGIKKIFYIDPYPGISYDQIINGGKSETQPKLIPFSGAIGNAYHKLYESFMAYKDEVTMILEVKPKQKLAKELNNILSKIDDAEIKKFVKEVQLNDDAIIELIKETIKGYPKQTN